MKQHIRLTSARKAWLSLVMMSLGSPLLQAQNSSALTLKVTLQEVMILQQLLQQIELSTEEIPSFLAIQNPLEQLIAQQQKATPSQEKVRLKLPAQSAHDLLVFMQRITIKGGGAKQVNALIEQVQKLLPKHSPFRAPPPASTQNVSFPLIAEEALLLQQLLLQIKVGIPEITAFLALYNPLEKALTKLEDAGELVLKLPEQGPQNLLIFMQRFELVGSQVSLVQGIIERLQQLQEQKT